MITAQTKEQHPRMGSLRLQVRANERWISAHTTGVYLIKSQDEFFRFLENIVDRLGAEKPYDARLSLVKVGRQLGMKRRVST